jgi:hypothetical protein
MEAARERARKILDEGVPREEQALYVSELRHAELAINIARRTQSRAGAVRIVARMDEDETEKK